MGWWCEVRGELTFLIAAPPWLLPSGTSQQAGCSCRPGLIELSWPPSLQRTAKCPTLRAEGRSQMGEREGRGAELGTFFVPSSAALLNYSKQRVRVALAALPRYW